MVHGQVKVIAKGQRASWDGVCLGFGQRHKRTAHSWLVIYDLSARNKRFATQYSTERWPCPFYSYNTRKKDKPGLQFFSIFFLYHDYYRWCTSCERSFIIFYVMLSNALLSRHQPVTLPRTKRKKRRRIYASELIDEKKKPRSFPTRCLSRCVSVCVASGVANTLEITINLPEREA